MGNGAMLLYCTLLVLSSDKSTIRGLVVRRRPCPFSQAPPALGLFCFLCVAAPPDVSYCAFREMRFVLCDLLLI